MISVTVEFSNVAAASSQDYTKVIVFPVVDGTNSYDAGGVPELSRLVGKEIGTEIFKIEYKGSDLLTSSDNVTWDDEDFVIDNSVTITDGKIIIWYY